MSFKVTTANTVKALDRLYAGFVEAAQEALTQIAEAAAKEARATTAFKDRKGDLRKSIQRGAKGPWAQFVKAGGPQAPYALFIESGSKAHKIAARRADFLRFEQGGRVVFRKQVRHPGTKPTRFMQSARDSAEEAASRIAESSIAVALSR